ncbi:MAG: LysR family transcriptional regulator [Myxococcales bacterium]|nr:LysR family transcriptional regulator [Myxococcales bacterium]MCB9712328.1 LysR family transcriptional regulator [Myxococcales bacterium]
MNIIDVGDIDLNLLKALDALLREGSVSRAAARLGIGQPAASHALGRLRELFGDPLLVRTGRRMSPTPRAEALREPLRRLLDDAARLVRHETAFDPARSTRSFGLACPDLLAPLLPRLVARLQAAAPHTRLEVLPRQRDDAQALEDGRIDLLLTRAPESGPGLVQRGLGTLGFSVLARRDHPGLSRRRTLGPRAWARHPHVMVRSEHGGRSIVAEALAASGFSRTVGLVVPTFLSALVTVAQTDLFFTVPEALVRPLLEPLGLRALRPPVPLPQIPTAALWHERFTGEPAHRFLREIVIDEVTAALAG